MSTTTLSQAIKYHEAVCSETHPATYDPSVPLRWNVGLDSYDAMLLLQRYTFKTQDRTTSSGFTTDLTVAHTSLHLYAVGYHHGRMER